MRLIFILTLFLGFLYSNPYEDVINYKLPNGLNVYLLPNKDSKNVSIEAVVNVGMRAESKESAGISHLVEHLVFRDQRVKYKDYYDFIEDEGASYVNGYTSDYKTKYVAKIDSKKAYWITEAFYKMLFDKNLTNEDLEVEKKALQLEIGEPKWTDSISFGFFKSIGKLIDKLYPKDNNYDLYEDDFKIDKSIDKWDRYDSKIYKTNNKKFTLKDVLKHYHDYYYPSNITLKIVGNFDAQKMRETIEKTFGKVKKRDGKTLECKIYKDAKLSNKPFIKNMMPGASPESYLYIGYKFLDDDITKEAIISSYFEYLADRLNRELRNKKGESYSVYGYTNSYRNAGLGSISFSTSHDNFEKNSKLAKEWLQKEAKGDISDEVIKKSLQKSKKSYDSLEKDSQSLMEVVDDIIYKKRYYKDGYKNPYDVINSITTDKFRETIKKEFKDSNLYISKAKDYYLFPFEAFVLLILTIATFIFISIKISRRKIAKKDIRLKVSIGNILVYIFTIFIALKVADILTDWIIYILAKLLYPKIIMMEYFGTPLDYLFIILSFILFVTVFRFVYKILFGWFYRKLIVANNKIYLLSPKHKEIEMGNIERIDIAPWSFDKFKNIYGFSLLFWKKLVKIITKDQKTYYIRYKKADELKETLKELKGSIDV